MGQPDEPGQKSNQRAYRYWVPGMLLVIILFVAAVRFRLHEMPLERDEGEFAYGGQLFLQGIPPYQMEYFMKFPGVHLAYALLMAVFGQTAAGVHLGFLAVNIATILMVFQLGKRLLGSGAALGACAIYAVMSLSPAVLGFAAHATHFVVLCSLAGILLLLRAIESGRLAGYFLSGSLLGLAILMKQPGAFFLLFGLVVVLWTEARTRPFNPLNCLKKTIVFTTGGILPIALTCLLLWRAGVFEQFWFCTVTLVRSYGSTNSLATGKLLLLGYIRTTIGYDAVFWMLGGLGMIGLLLDQSASRARPLVAGLALFSVAAASQGLYFRPHYFVLALPALALAIGAGVKVAHRLTATWPGFTRWLPTALFAGVVAGAVWQRKEMYFQITPDEACRKIYPGHPFCESVTVGRYIQDHTAPGCRVAVLGSEPQIYFYAGRLSATGYIYTFEMMERNRLAKAMQKDMIQQIEAVRPQILVIVKCFFSWGNRSDSDYTIFNWMDEYWGKHYDVEGVADFSDYPKPSHYYWGAEAISHAHGPSQSMYVLRRKPEPSPQASRQSIAEIDRMQAAVSPQTNAVTGVEATK